MQGVGVWSLRLSGLQGLRGSGIQSLGRVGFRGSGFLKMISRASLRNTEGTVMGPGFLHTTLSHTFRYLSFWIALHAPTQARRPSGMSENPKHSFVPLSKLQNKETKKQQNTTNKPKNTNNYNEFRTLKDSDECENDCCCFFFCWFLCVFWFPWFFARADEPGQPHAVAFLLGLGSASTRLLCDLSYAMLIDSPAAYYIQAFCL